MITSAAVKITLLNGEEKIIPCHRHGEAYYILHTFNIERDKTKDKEGFIKWVPDDDDPLYSGHAEFVDRIEAFKHAEECCQFICEPLAANDVIKELYSEDLW